MQVIFAILLCLSVGKTFAGYAFPSKSRENAITLFQSQNIDIDWDWSNYLVDLSGRYSDCKAVGQKGAFTVRETTKDGSSVGGLVDSEVGEEGHVNAVNAYLARLLRRWSRDPDFSQQIQKALKFGCSVATRCGGRIVAACLFTPAVEDGNRGIEDGRSRARAFTSDQYLLAEKVTNTRWDGTYELENLAGYDIGCGMITQRPWNFPRMTEYAEARGLDIDPLYGAAPNEGATEPAIISVIENFGKTPASKEVGCALIPDCLLEGKMYVVVNCLYKRA